MQWYVVPQRKGDEEGWRVVTRSGAAPTSRVILGFGLRIQGWAYARMLALLPGCPGWSGLIRSALLWG